MSAHKGVISVESQEVPDLPLTNAVFDPVGDTMLCTFGPSKEFKSIEIQQISVSVTIASWLSCRITSDPLDWYCRELLSIFSFT